MQCAQTLLRVKTKGNFPMSPGAVGIQQNILCERSDALTSSLASEKGVSGTSRQGSTSVPQAVEIKRLYKTAEGTEV